ncbi:MAG: hypothetical protein IK062_11375 [Selenomonadaceae bacterium]|nr:hypothetical protein [Selenomonadaceae bacterium]
MKVAEKNFREIYKKICLLKNSELVKKINLRDVFDYPPEENLSGFVVYGCIDSSGEFIFKILAGAAVVGEKIKIFPASYKKNIFFRRAEVEEVEIKILPSEYFSAFKDKIQVIEDLNKTDDTIEKIRAAEILDESRHPNFPDDIAVLFFAENLRPEYAWVRCENIDGKFIVGKLLNNLQQNFGYSVGEKIKFGVTDFEGENICILVEN